MKVARSLFEIDGYPDRFPEFKRLMAFCDMNNLRMAFYDEIPYIGIRVYAANDEAVTASANYTLYYDTMERKVFFLGFENWDEGMELLSKFLSQVAEEYGESITLIVPDQEQAEALYVKRQDTKKKFDFQVRYNGYVENVVVFDESKWLAIAQMRKLYPGRKFDIIEGRAGKWRKQEC